MDEYISKPIRIRQLLVVWHLVLGWNIIDLLLSEELVRKQLPGFRGGSRPVFL